LDSTTGLIENQQNKYLSLFNWEKPGSTAPYEASYWRKNDGKRALLVISWQVGPLLKFQKILWGFWGV
jgi:hypothetical protein